MNVVVLLIDTLRYDHVGANGNPAVRTPNLDRLAGRSWTFERAFAASFATIPCRNDVLTGRYGGPFHTWTPLDCDARTIPGAMIEQGYLTQLIHDNPHLVNGGNRFDYPFNTWTPIRGAENDRAWFTDSFDFPENWAFDPLFDGAGVDRDPDAVAGGLVQYAHTNHGRSGEEDWSVSKLFRTASAFLEDNAARDNFLLWLDCFDPHEPWDSPPEYVRMYDDTPGYEGTYDPRLYVGANSYPDHSAAARERIDALYKANTTFMDRWLGEFLDTLDETGLRENTAIVVMGDHGTNLGDAPGRAFGKESPPRQNEAHVPLFVDVPGEEGGRCDALAQPQDLFATVAALADASVPDGVESYDLVSVARDGRDPREVALTGTSVDGWEGADPDDVLFSAFDGEWCLGVTHDPAAADLRRLGEPAEPVDDRPAVADRLYRLALEEIDRRGLDPALSEWLQSDTTAGFPDEYRVSSAHPAPPGYQGLRQRLPWPGVRD